MTDPRDKDTPADWVYVVRPIGQRPVKIGTAKNVESRVAGLQTGSPHKLETLATIRTPAVPERTLHRHFGAYRISGEWFDFGDLDPVVTVCEGVAAIARGDAPVTRDDLDGRLGTDTDLRAFDHSQLACRPQYAQASKALDALAHELPDSMTRKQFLDTVREMAAVLPYSDGCNECGRLVLAAPFKVVLTGEGMVGHYRCERGHVWTCWHALGWIGFLEQS